MIKVLVVDDSALVRSIVSAVINDQPDMRAVGAASNPLQAREMIKQLHPDVLTLDVEMPGMDGLDFLERLMRLRPMPVLMISSLTTRGAEATLRALELGAIDFVSKPALGVAQGLEACAAEIVAKIRAAARSHVLRREKATPPTNVPTSIREAASKIILVGASTGGTEAIRVFLERMPREVPPIVIVQHMPPGYTASFARRLDGNCRITVKEAEHGERPLPGHAYIAPGGRHVVLQRSGAYYQLGINDDELVNLFRPSVDKLFFSATRIVGQNAAAVLMTGMGRDGAEGMLALRKAGVYTLAQSEASCVVFGMPREAIRLQAVDDVADVPGLADRALAHFATPGG